MRFVQSLVYFVVIIILFLSYIALQIILWRVSICTVIAWWNANVPKSLPTSISWWINIFSLKKSHPKADYRQKISMLFDFKYFNLSFWSISHFCDLKPFKSYVLRVTIYLVFNLSTMYLPIFIFYFFLLNNE